MEKKRVTKQLHTHHTLPYGGDGSLIEKKRVTKISLTSKY